MMYAPMHREVRVSPTEVAQFAQSWPCANMPRRAVTFGFDADGNLLDVRWHGSPDASAMDGNAEAALSMDALVALVAKCPVLFTPVGKLTASNYAGVAAEGR